MRSVLSHDVAKPAASAPCGGRLPCAKTIDEVERGRDDHHQPLRQIHLSRREICLKKRSHPSDRRVYERRLPNDLAITKTALEPYRAELVAVAVESTFNWYWLVDGLMDAGYQVP